MSDSPLVLDGTELSLTEQQAWLAVFASAFVFLTTNKAPVQSGTMPSNFFYEVLGDERSQLVVHAETIANEAIRGARELREIEPSVLGGLHRRGV